MVQGESTSGFLRPMQDSIFAADRGCNYIEIIASLSDELRESFRGTHKRHIWYPFVFGYGPILRKHRVMDVSERGCRAVFTASLKAGCARASQVRRTETNVYRESCSGCIAALVHKNLTLFPSGTCTIVLWESLRLEGSLQKLEESLAALNEHRKCALPTTRASATRSHTANNGKKNVQQLLSRCSVFYLRTSSQRTQVTFSLAFAAVYRLQRTDSKRRRPGTTRLCWGSLVGATSKMNNERTDPLLEDHIVVRELV